MSELKRLTDLILTFRDARDWKQFHHPKDLAIALSVEAAELLELFRFKSECDPAGLRHELADVLYFVLLLAHEGKVDLAAALEEKMQLNEQRYPVALSRGKNLKYDEL